MKKMIFKFFSKRNNLKHLLMLLFAFLATNIAYKAFPEQNLFETINFITAIGLNLYSILLLTYNLKFSKILNNPVKYLVIEIDDKKFKNIIQKETKKKNLVLNLENNSKIIFKRSQQENDIILKILTDQNQVILDGPLSKIDTAFRFNKKSNNPEIKFATVNNFKNQTTIDLALKHIKNMKKEESIEKYIQNISPKNTIQFKEIYSFCSALISFKDKLSADIIDQINKLKINIQDLQNLENEHKDFILTQSKDILVEIRKYANIENSEIFLKDLKENDIDILDILKDLNSLIEQTNQKDLLKNLNLSLEDTKIKTYIFDELTV